MDVYACLASTVPPSHLSNLYSSGKRKGSIRSTEPAEAGYVAQSVQCLPSIHETWVLSQTPHKPGVVAHTYEANTWKAKIRSEVQGHSRLLRLDEFSQE